MPDPCFCRLELVASNPARLRYTYLGYICTDGVVTAIDSLTNLVSGDLPVAPPGTSMPTMGDPCTCDGVEYCSPITPVLGPGELAPRRRAAQEAVAPELITPCHEQISVNLDILGQWNARTSAFPGQMLRLVMLGRHERCCRFRIILIAYIEDNQCLADCTRCFLEDCDIVFGPGGLSVFIGTDGKKIGPFLILDRLSPATLPAPAAAKAEVKPTR
jgi:hypothetical protein